MYWLGQLINVGVHDGKFYQRGKVISAGNYPYIHYRITSDYTDVIVRLSRLPIGLVVASIRIESSGYDYLSMRLGLLRKSIIYPGMEIIYNITVSPTDYTVLGYHNGLPIILYGMTEVIKEVKIENFTVQKLPTVEYIKTYKLE